MRLSRAVLACLAVIAACGSASAQVGATLVPSPDSTTVYDTVNNISWLADANFAATNRFGLPLCASPGTQTCVNASGSMRYDSAVAWVQAMNAANYLGHSNWQLPTTPTNDSGCGRTGPTGSNFGFGCTASAFGSLWNALVLKAPNTAVPIPSNTVGPFSNFQPYLYWSQSGAPPPAGNYTFSFATGWQGANTLPNFLYVLPMIPGKLPGTRPATGNALQVNPGGQTVYDPVTNITWLANANIAASDTFGLPPCENPTTPALCIAPDGAMTYASASQLIVNMNAFIGTGFLGQTSWQLPTIASDCPGYTCAGTQNPMGNLFYDQLNFSQGMTVVTPANIAVGPFRNIQPYLYWACGAATTQAGCQVDGPALNFEWSFSFGSGFEGTDLLANDLYVTAYYAGPMVSVLTPSNFTAGGGAFTLTVNGSGFVSGSTVTWNGAVRTTTFVSPTQLTVAITAADVAVAGWDQMTVFNPGEGISNAVAFTVTTGSNAPTVGAALNYVPVTPCRLVDTRTAPDGPFAGPSITGGTSRNFAIPQNSVCNIPPTAAAYSLNVAVIPSGPLGFLTLWPAGQTLPVAATLSSSDGRVRSNAAIVPAGTGGAISVYASNMTDLVMDIDGYFTTATTELEFYPVTPCRVVDTRNTSGTFGGPSLAGNTSRRFPLQSSSCNLPSSAQAYSLNLAVVPQVPLGYLTAWPSGQPQPETANLSSVTGTVTASAAIVPAGANGSIEVYASNSTDLIIDVNGYFAPAGTGGLSLYTLPPCRVLDTRNPSNGAAGTGQPFSGELDENIQASACGVPVGAQAYVLNATVVPSTSFGYLTLWPQGTAQPLAATLSALDATVTSNLAIVPTTNGSIGMFAANATQLVVDTFGYFGPSSQAPAIISANNATFTMNALGSFTVIATGFPGPTLSETGTLPAGVTFTAGVLSGIPTLSGTFPITFTAHNGVGANFVQNFTLTVTSASSTPAPIANLFPNSLTFASQNIDSAGTAMSAILANTGNASLLIDSISVSGDFGESDNCPESLAAGANCTIQVTFEPTATGTRTGTLTVDDNSSTNPQTVGLTGTGGAAAFYVSPSGNDAWSGTLPASNSDSTDGPFKTFDHARSIVQGLNKTGLSQVVVQFRGGTYFLPATENFTSADSGTAITPIIYENYPGDSPPIVSGGMQVLNWTNTTGNIWQATLPSSTKYFENLFYNGVRRLRPRLGGSLGTYLRIAATYYAATESANCSVQVTSQLPGPSWECFDRFYYATGAPITNTWKNLAPAAGNLCGQPTGNPALAGDIELLDFERYTASKLRISCIDTTNQIVYLTGPTDIAQPPNTFAHGFIPTHRYLIENIQDELTQAGQSFLDRSTTPWTLTYLANPGENPNTDTVIIPQLPEVLAAFNLQYVTFQGLTFEHDNYTVPAVGHPDTELPYDVSAAVSFQNAQNITFNSDVVTQTSGAGLEFISCLNAQLVTRCVSGSTSSVTANNVVENSAFYDLGEAGVRVGIQNLPVDTDANVPQFITVENNVVDGYGRVYPNAWGIAQGDGHDNTYTHNDVYDGYHTAIGACQCTGNLPNASSHGTFNNTISFNHVYNLFQGIMNDAGSLYVGVGNAVFTAAGNKILYNKVHDVSDASAMDADGYGGDGIYLDQQTGLTDVENNLVYRVSDSTMNIYGAPFAPNMANTVTNNIFAFGRLSMINDSNFFISGSVPASADQAVVAANNLFYFDRNNTSTTSLPSPGPEPFYVQGGCTYTGGFPYTAYEHLTSNLYWRTDGAFASYTKAFHVQSQPGANSPCAGGPSQWTFYTFAGWQQTAGEDTQSVVQNPGFNNPAYPADDYSLPKGSPGFGFVVFDPGLAGRSNPVIDPPAVPATFSTVSFNPATDF